MPVSDLARLAAIPRVDIRALSTLFVAAACGGGDARDADDDHWRHDAIR